MMMKPFFCSVDKFYHLAFEDVFLEKWFTEPLSLEKTVEYISFKNIKFKKGKAVEKFLAHLNKQVAKGELFNLDFSSNEGYPFKMYQKDRFMARLATIGKVLKVQDSYFIEKLTFQLTLSDVDLLEKSLRGLTSLDLQYPHECALCKTDVYFLQIMERDLNHDHLYELKDGKYRFTLKSYLTFYERWKELKKIWMTPIIVNKINEDIDGIIEMKQEFLCNACHSTNISIDSHVIHEKHEKKPKRRMRISHEEEQRFLRYSPEILRDVTFFNSTSRRETCRCDGPDIFPGAIVTIINEQREDIDLCARGERPLGVVISSVFPLTISFEHSLENPFPDNEWVIVEKIEEGHVGFAYIRHHIMDAFLTPGDLLCCEDGFLVKTEDPSEAIAQFVSYTQGMEPNMIKVARVRWR